MSEFAKKARAAMKERAQRRAEPGKSDIDASGWREPTINTGAKTGMTPISKRAFKRGGKVNLKAEGAEAKKHAGKKPRAAGGDVGYINRNVKEANEKRGNPHVGGYKKGGAAHSDVAEDKKLIKSMVKGKALKAGGGSAANPYAENEGAGAVTPVEPKVAPGKTDRLPVKTQPKTRGPYKEDPYEDRPLVEGNYKRGGKAAHAKGCTCKACGGRAAKKEGGTVDKSGTRPTGGRTAKAGGGGFEGFSNPSRTGHKDGMDDVMAGIAASQGGFDPAKLSKMGSKIYNALSGSGKAVDDTAAGTSMSSTPYTRKKGGRVERKSGGKVAKGKGKTNIHININTQPKPPMDGLPPMMPPMPLPPAAQRMAPPPGGPAPMGGMPPGGLPPGLGVPPPAMGPAVARKAGGRVYKSYKDMDAGAGSGLGRLEKSEIQKRK